MIYVMVYVEDKSLRLYVGVMGLRSRIKSYGVGDVD